MKLIPKVLCLLMCFAIVLSEDIEDMYHFDPNKVASEADKEMNILEENALAGANEMKDGIRERAKERQLYYANKVEQLNEYLESIQLKTST